MFRLNVILGLEKRERSVRNTAAMFIARESAGADAYIPVYMSVHGSIVIDIVTFICLISNQFEGNDAAAAGYIFNICVSE